MNITGNMVNQGALQRPASLGGGLSEMSDILLRAAVRAQSAIYGLRNREDGQTMTEYAIIIAAVAVLLIVALLFLSGKIGDLFSNTGSSVTNPIS
jgi:Flp pilus assembly pilin Flp